MNRPHVPFVWLDGCPYLDVSYELEPTGTRPPLRRLLDALLAHHREEEVLLLRPLSAAETRLLRQSTEGAAVESWAPMVVKPEDRARPRPGARRGRAGR
jgi:hypothetical protein